MIIKLIVTAASAVMLTSAGRAQDMPLATPEAVEEQSARQAIKEKIDEYQEAIRKLRQVEDAVAQTKGSWDADASLAPKIENGVLTSRHATAGALLKFENGVLSAHCSGTLIGSRTFLTAQHCFEDGTDKATYRVFFQHAGIFELSDIVLHDGYDFPTADLAIVKLARTVNSIRPMPIRTAPVPLSSEGLIAGFGRSGGKATDYGLKRVGSIITAQCNTRYDNSKLVCWDYADPLGLPGADSNTCNADSGGPLYIMGEARFELAGVTSGGLKSSCLSGDHSYNVSVPVYSAWITQTLGLDTALPTGSIVFGPGSNVRAEASRLTPASSSRSYKFALRPSTRTVHIAFHGHDDGTATFGWSTEFRPDASGKTQQCKPSTGQWGFCTFATGPKSGSLDIDVARVQGEGQFQVTVTELD